MCKISSLALLVFPFLPIFPAVPALAQSCYMELDNGQIMNLASICDSQGNQPLPPTPPRTSATAPTPECSAKLAERAEPINPPAPLPLTWRDPNIEDVFLFQQLDPRKPYPTAPGDRFVLYLSEQETSSWAWDGSSWYLWDYDNEGLWDFDTESSSPLAGGVFLMQNVCTGVLSF
jgi:hypothetical protein